MRLIDADAIPWDVEGIGDIPVVTREEINDMPTVDAFGCWIPVTDRLPDATGLYLVSCYQVYDYVTISTFELYEGGSYWTEIGVEAWMPIPDPYKGEKK